MGKTIGIIPARYGSSRFPGKVLCDILGKPMIWHTYHSANKWKQFDELYVATEDEIVKKVCNSYDIPCLMTSDKHIDCLDRAYEAMGIIGSNDLDRCIIIQGDEPLFDYTILNKLNNIHYEIRPIINFYTKSTEDIDDPNAVKVIVSKYGNAMYFSRYSIPFREERTRRNKECEVKVYKQLGIYAIRYHALIDYNKLGMSYLESLEGIGLLRYLENDRLIKMVYTDKDSISVDTPKDRERIIEIMENRK